MPMATSSAARMLATLRANAEEASRCERWTAQAEHAPRTSGKQLTRAVGADRRRVRRALIRGPQGGFRAGGRPSYAPAGRPDKTGKPAGDLGRLIARARRTGQVPPARRKSRRGG